MPEAPKPPTKKRPDAINMHLANKAGALPIAPYTGPEMHAPTSGDIQANLPTAGGVIRPQAPYEKAAGAIQNSTLGTLFSTGANIQNNVRDSVGNVLNMPLPGNPQVGGQALNVGDANDISSAMMAFHVSPFAGIQKPLAGESLRSTGVGDQWQGSGLYVAQHPDVTRYYRNMLAGNNDYPRLVKYDETGLGKARTIHDAVVELASDENFRHVSIDDMQSIVREMNYRFGGDAKEFGQMIDDSIQHIMNTIQIDLKEIEFRKREGMPQVDSLEKLVSHERDTLQRLGTKRGILNAINAKMGEGALEYNPGLYAADVPDPTVKKMLHLDQPLTMQPSMVRNNVLNVFRAIKDKYGSSSFAIDDVYRNTPFGMQYKHTVDPERIMQQTPFQPVGWDIYHTLANLTESPQEVSDKLNQSGVPGNRYLDKHSRAGMEDFLKYRQDNPTARQQWFKNTPYSENLVLFDPATSIRKWKPLDLTELPRVPVKKLAKLPPPKKFKK